MNKNLLKMVLERKEKFIPLIFTEKQMDILNKYYTNKKLTNSEKKSLYTSIKKKMEALETIKIEKDNEFFINGFKEIIPERLEEAKKIIENYSKRYKQIFISGSFLFSKKFNDIDIFIIRGKGYKEKWEGNKHTVFLTEKKLQNPVFQSAAKISISNFIIPSKLKLRPLKLGEFMSSYHEAGIEIMDNQERELSRYIVFSYYLYIHNKLLDGVELSELTKSLTLEKLDNIVKSVMVNLFSKSYLYVVLHEYTKTLNEFIESEKNIEHLKRYKSLYEEIIHETRRSAKASA